MHTKNINTLTCAHAAGRISKNDKSRIHDESRHVRCEQCDKIFHFPGDLKKHYIRMHGATPNQLCPVCPQKFMSQCKLTQANFFFNFLEKSENFLNLTIFSKNK